MKRRVSVDAIAGAIVVMLSMAVAVGAMRFPPTSGTVAGPALFPLLLAAIWGPLGLILLLKHLRVAPVGQAAAPVRPMVGLLGLSVAYAGVLPLLGFVSASALYLTIAIEFLGYRHRWRAGAVALSLAFLVFWVFRGVMAVPLPDGWIG